MIDASSLTLFCEPSPALYGLLSRPLSCAGFNPSLIPRAYRDFRHQIYPHVNEKISKSKTAVEIFFILYQNPFTDPIEGHSRCRTSLLLCSWLEWLAWIVMGGPTWKHRFDHMISGFSTGTYLFLGPFLRRSSISLQLPVLSRNIWHAAFAIWLIINNNRYDMFTRLSSHGTLGLSLLLEDWQPVEKAPRMYNTACQFIVNACDKPRLTVCFFFHSLLRYWIFG